MNRAPDGCCPYCWQPHDFLHGEPCYAPNAAARTYGAEDGPTWSTDRFQTFVLGATNPRQDTTRGAHGFQIEEAKRVANVIRAALADGTLTIDDLVAASPIEEGERDR